MKADWIPADERLPEKTNPCDEYLVTIGKNYVTTLYWNDMDKEWYNDHSVTVRDVRAWMELPDPYRKKTRRGG